MIGAEEFILVDVPRCVEATAITDCELGYIEQEDFFKRKKILSITILIVFNEEDVKSILQSGGLDYLDPVSVARSFLNF